MKKIILIANARIPTEKAHGLQMMKMCEAFADEGNTVTLLAPSRKNKITTDPYEFYSVKKNFSIVYIKCPDFVRFGPVGFMLTTWIFAILAVSEALRRGFDFVFSRDIAALWVLSWTGKRYLFEIHDDQRKIGSKRVLRKCAGLVSTNRALIKLHNDHIHKEILTLHAPSAVSTHEVPIGESKEDIRDELGLPQNAKIVLYAGHLYAYKGADILADAAMRLSEFTFVFIGGMKGDIESFREKYGYISNIKILGHKPHNEVPYYLRAADLLVLPNTAKDEFSLLYTSPIKLFEYMASGTPILSSDIPSIREILNDETGYFFTPDNVESLAGSITRIFDDPAGSAARAAAATEDVKKYSYTERAKRILGFMDDILSRKARNT